MGLGFGLTRQEMLDAAEGSKPVLRDVQSLSDWLWYINSKGSMAEAVAATSFAIEGVAGDIARKVVSGFESYKDEPGVQMGPKTYKWFREHAHYDDDHPKIAMEIVKRYATTERMQTKVMLAAKRSIQLLHNALMTGYKPTPCLQIRSLLRATCGPWTSAPSAARVNRSCPSRSVASPTAAAAKTGQSRKAARWMQ